MELPYNSKKVIETLPLNQNKLKYPLSYMKRLMKMILALKEKLKRLRLKVACTASAKIIEEEQIKKLD